MQVLTEVIPQSKCYCVWVHRGRPYTCMCVCSAYLIINIAWGEVCETCFNKITLVYTLIQVFPRVILCNSLLCISVWMKVTSGWHFVQTKNEASFCRACTIPFQVVRSISTTIRIAVLVMGYFKVWTGEGIFHVKFSECVFFFSPSLLKTWP